MTTSALPCRRAGAMLTLVFSLTLLSGCAGFATFSDALFMMTPDQEVQMGQKIGVELEKEVVLVNDPALTGYVRDLGQRIWTNSGGGPIAPRFFVVKDKELNAFAIPGGNIYIQTGLIDAAEDEAELAGVMAHELGHVILRHGARNISRQQGLGLVQQLVLGEDAGEVTKLVTGIIQSGVMTDYSRQDEQQADELSVRTLYRMEYDPLALRTFFGKLKDKYGEQTGPVAKLFASHPPTSERMDHVTQMVAQLASKPFVRPVTDLRRAQGRLRQLGF